MQSLRLEWKLHFTYAYLLPVTIVAGAFFNIYTNAQSPFSAPSLEQLYLIYEVLMPLVLSLGLATLLPYERDEGMLELRLSYAQPFELALLRKVLLPICCWFALAVGGGLWAHHYYLSFSAWHLALVTVPPTLFLGGLTLLVSALTLNSPLSMMFPLGWWAWELLTGGRKSGLLALLPYTYANTQVPLNLNRGLLVCVGLLLLVIGLILVRRSSMEH